MEFWAGLSSRKLDHNQNLNLFKRENDIFLHVDIKNEDQKIKMGPNTPITD